MRRGIDKTHSGLTDLPNYNILIPMKIDNAMKIGNGSFTIAYEKDAKNVILKSIDPTKKILANKVFKSPMIPRIVHIDTADGFDYYVMPKLHVLGKNKNKRFLNSRSKKWMEKYDLGCFKANQIYSFIENMQDFPDEQKALLEIVECMFDSGIEFMLEIYDMNIAVDKKTGNLIFFDMIIDLNSKYINHL